MTNDDLKCQHGERNVRRGVSDKGKKWAAAFCPAKACEATWLPKRAYDALAEAERRVLADLMLDQPQVQAAVYGDDTPPF
jgi:hypothetical protein